MDDRAVHGGAVLDLDVTESLVEALGRVPGVEHDALDAVAASDRFEGFDQRPSHALPPAILLDGHVSNLCFVGAVPMQPAHAQQAPLGIADREMIGRCLQLVAFRTARLVPRGTEDTPTQVVVLRPLGVGLRAT